MIGTTLAHYRITGELGAGGMGEVWRATDEKLGREVALKVLSEEFASDPRRLDRFEREARAVAALNHPHIVTIFSVEDADGVRFLTMELVEGRPLDKMIPESGFDAESFFQYATPLAEAISAAHDKSVIHRDLKPSNVMVDGDGRVKVLDFGLAKLQSDGEVSDSSELPTEALTGVGMVVGTVPYMSPEQVEGKIVDHRTDVFSLGVLLYEMATGERPFQGESSAGLMSSILRDAPAPVGDRRDDLPNHLGRIITRCLEKDRRDRYQTARDVFNELRALQRESTATGSVRSPAVSPPRRTQQPRTSSSQIRHGDVPWIAVLPFGCPGGDAEIETFADGLEEDIATGLSRFSYLFVVARKSTRRYRGEAIDVRQVAEELGARFVMEGGIRRAGSRIRIGMNLIDAATGTHLWSETFDRDLEAADVFELQDEVTGRIVATAADSYGILVHSIAAGSQDKAESEYAPWEWLIRLFGYRQRPTPAEHSRLRDSLEEAVDRDPDIADAWACLSQIYLDEHGFGFNARADAPNRALAAAQRAVDLDRSSQLGYQVLAQSQFFRRDLKAFRSAADRAMSLNPRDSNSIGVLGLLIVLSGEFVEGAEISRRAMDLNPNHAGWYHFGPIWESFHNRDYEKALEHAKQVNMPGMFGQHLAVAAACGHLGLRGEGEVAVNDLLAHDPDIASTLRENLEIWHFASGLVDSITEGLGKAGLTLPGVETRLASRESEKKTRDVAESAVAIAVLPFSDLSPTKDQDYFCEGMAEEIMNALVHVDGIQVASRTAAFRAIEEGGDLQAIGRALSVGQVLEGSVRMAGTRLRVTAQLTEVESGYQLWSERYDREAEDVFAIQDEIAAGVVDAVTSRLDSGERVIRARDRVKNLEAYQLYLKGRHYRYSKNDHGSALQCYEEAVALDPSHGPSLLGVADAKIMAATYNLVPVGAAHAEAQRALESATKILGETAEGRYIEGLTAYRERDWPTAERVLRRAIEIEPDHVKGLCWCAMTLVTTRRVEEGMELFERAQKVDPLSAYPYGMTTMGWLLAADPKSASEAGRQGLVFDDQNTLALWGFGVAEVALGHFDAGIQALEKAVEFGRRNPAMLGVLGWAFGAAGRAGEARAILDELRARTGGSPAAVSEAWLLAALGEDTAAWEVLERALTEQQSLVVFTEYPGYDPLRSDTRFPAFVKRLGLPPSPSAAVQGPSVEKAEIVEQSIAVLPFVNMSANQEDEYFSDGLSEEIINALTRIPNLRVIARTSAFRFRGEQDLRAVGEALGVCNVLEGSVRRAGERLRITAQLIDVADDSHIWSERFDREMTDVFEIQDEIADAIVQKLHVSFGSSAPVRRPTTNVKAYEALLEARHFFFQFTPEAAERALACLQEALSLEPDYPDALVEYSFYHVMMAYMFADPRVELAKARGLLERALKLDPDHGEAQAGVAVMSVVLDWDWLAGERHFRRALELSPSSARIHELRGLIGLLGVGRLDEALAELDRAVELDPLSALYAGNRGRVLTCSRRFPEAEETCRRGLALDPGQLLAQVELIYALTFQRKFDEAVAMGRRAVESHGGTKAVLNALAVSLALAGERDEAWRLLNDDGKSGGTAYRSPLTPGLVHAACSEMDAAFECVGQAIDEKDPMLMYLQVHPMFDALRDDPRYPELLRRVNLIEGGGE